MIKIPSLPHPLIPIRRNLVGVAKRAQFSLDLLIAAGIAKVMTKTYFGRYELVCTSLAVSILDESARTNLKKDRRMMVFGRVNPIA